MREEKQNTLVECAEREGLKQRIAEMKEFLNGHTGIIEEYEEQLVRRLVEKVTVFEGRLVVEFRSGAVVEVKERNILKPLCI